MKTPRHEQPWYSCRLENNKKPEPLTEEEKTIMSGVNRKLIDDAPRLIAYGVQKGWISYPKKPRTQHTWITKDSPPLQQDDSSTFTTDP
jgi:hypothetical protein